MSQATTERGDILQKAISSISVEGAFLGPVSSSHHSKPYRKNSSILQNTTFSDAISGYDEHLVVGGHQMTSLPAYTKPIFVL